MLPQEMPTGAEFTVPEPVPVRVTVRLNWVGGEARVKLAVQLVDFVISTTFTVIPVPTQAPDHPLKLDPAVGVAVRVMLVWFGKLE